MDAKKLITKLTQKQKISIICFLGLLVVIIIANSLKKEQEVVAETIRLTPIEKIYFPSRQSFYISFPNFTETEVRPGQTYTVDYEIPNAEKMGEIDVAVKCFDGYQARVEKSSNSKGVIHITTPDTLKRSEVYLIASRKNETPVLYTINMRKRISVSIPSTVFASSGMDTYPVDLPLDLNEYIVSIPEADRYWIESMKGDSIGLDYKSIQEAEEEEEDNSIFGQIKGFFSEVQEYIQEQKEIASEVNGPITLAKEPKKKYENVLNFKIYDFKNYEQADSTLRYSIVRLINEKSELLKTIFITQTNISKLAVKMDKPGAFVDKIFIGDYESVTSLSIEGPMDSADFSKLKDFKTLQNLDLSATTVNEMRGQLNTRELRTVILPKTLKRISDKVFSELYNLRTVDLSNTEIIGEYAFTDCKNLQRIKLSTNLKQIGDFAFSGCSQLTEVTIPESVDSIGRSAFSRCTNLSNVQLTEGLKSINHYAFGECPSLKSIFIPSSVEYIGERVFYGCRNLTRFTSKYSPDGRSLVINDVLRAVTTSGLTRYTIPASTKAIGEFVFFDCSNLTEIVIPSSVTEIRNSAFFGCTGLSSINIPNSVEKIKTTAFAYWTGLRKIRFPESVTTVESWAFDGCSNLTEVELSSSTTKILHYAFTSCKSLVTFNIPTHTDNIGNYAFAGSGLVKVDMPKDVSTLGRSVFQLCVNLEELNCNSMTPPVVDSILGESLKKLNSIYVPNQSVGTYKSSIGWKEHSLKGAN